MQNAHIDMEPVTALLSKRCFAAADRAAQCAADCLSRPESSDTDECAEWCMVAARVLSACADVVGGWTDGSRLHLDGAGLHLTVPLVHAGLVAAEECAAAAAEFADDIPTCAAVAESALAAAVELRHFLDERTPLGQNLDQNPDREFDRELDRELVGDTMAAELDLRASAS